MMSRVNSRLSYPSQPPISINRDVCAFTSHPPCVIDSYNADLERVVRQRVRRGRHFPIMKVIPPGLDFSNLKISPPPDPLEAINAAGSGKDLDDAKQDLAAIERSVTRNL